MDTTQHVQFAPVLLSPFISFGLLYLGILIGLPEPRRLWQVILALLVAASGVVLMFVDTFQVLPSFLAHLF